jgi:uncharacterized protein involved in outer membrane biogenesis
LEKGSGIMAVRKRTIFGATLAVLLLLAGGLIAALLVVDPNAYRGIVETRAQAALGRELVVAGDMELGIWPTPRIVLGDVRLANVAGGSREHMARVERIEAELFVLPLLSGDVRVGRIVASGADLLLERGADGTPNWRFDGEGGSDGGDAAQPAGTAAKDGGPPLPYLPAIAVEDSRVAYAAGGVTRTLRIEGAEIEAASLDSPVEWSLEGALDDAALSLAFETGSLAALTGNERWRISGRARLADAELAVDGTLTAPMRAAGADLSIEIDLPSDRAPAALTAGAPPALPPLALRARLVDRDDHLALSDLRLTLGEARIAGALRLMPQRDPVLLAGDLSAGTIDAAAFSAGAPDGAGDGRLIPATAIPYAALELVDADLELAVDRLVLGSERIEAVSAGLRIEGGRLALELAEARIAGGRASGRLTLDAGGAAPTARLQLTAERLDIGGLLARQAGSASLQGPLGLDLAVEGAGDTVRAVLAGGGGRVHARLGRSTVASRYLDLLGASLVSALIPDFEERDTSTITCAVARMTLSNGVLHTGGLVIDTPRVTIAGEGGVDLLDERIEMTLRPQPKTTTLMALVAPVRVHGPLTSPSYSVDPGDLAADVGSAVLLSAVNPLAVLVPLVSAGSGEGNPCAAALEDPRPAPRPDGLPQRLLEGARGAAQGAGEAAGAVGRGVGEAVGGAAREAGEAIEGLFGD